LTLTDAYHRTYAGAGYGLRACVLNNK